VRPVNCRSETKSAFLFDVVRVRGRRFIGHVLSVSDIVASTCAKSHDAFDDGTRVKRKNE
jgi:hypothetical protein